MVSVVCVCVCVYSDVNRDCLHHFTPPLCICSKLPLFIKEDGNIVNLFTGLALRAAKVQVTRLTWMALEPEYDQPHVITGSDGWKKRKKVIELIWGKWRACTHTFTHPVQGPWALSKLNLHIYLAKLSWLNAPVVVCVCLKEGAAEETGHPNRICSVPLYASPATKVKPAVRAACRLTWHSSSLGKHCLVIGCLLHL